jgi:hypothetical protein
MEPGSTTRPVIKRCGWCSVGCSWLGGGRGQLLRCTAAEMDGAWVNDQYLSKKVWVCGSGCSG